LRTFFLTGATGYIGGSIAVGLVGRGDRVRGLVRTAGGAARLAALGAEPVLGTLDDAELLRREAESCDAVVNAASADHAGAVKALLAGLDGSAKPLLHTSGSSVIGDDARGGRRSETVFDDDERTRLVVNPMKQARRELDLSVLGASTRGVRSIVICPSLIYGDGRGPSRDSVQVPFLAANARQVGRVQIVGAGVNVWSTVHLDDVVALYLLALDKAPAGAFYFAENGEASFAEIGAAIARRLGLERVESLDPDEAARRWGESKAWFTLGSNSRVRAQRARRELGWAPRHSSVLDWIDAAMPLDAGEPSTP
jgi:nucleoside-diphosphate-sugar epimerase